MLTGEVGPGDSVAVFGCGGVGCAAVAGARLAGASTIIAVDLDARQAGPGPGVRRHPHGRRLRRVTSSRPSGPLTDGNGADVCIEAVGNPAVMEQAFYARDLAGTLVQVGVPTPDMRIDLPMIDFFGRGGRLKPSLVRRLPAEPRLPHADRPVPAGPARPRPLRLRDDRARRRRGGVRTGWSAARCCAPSWWSGDRTGRHLRHFSLDGADFDVDNNIWVVGDDPEVVVIDAAHDHRPIADGGRWPADGGRSSPPTATTTTSTPPSPWPTPSARRSGSIRTTACCGTSSIPDRPPDGELADGQMTSTVGGTTLRVLHTPGHSPGGCCLYDEADGVLFSGDTLFNGGTGGHRAELLGLPHHHRLDPRPPARAAGDHPGAAPATATRRRSAPRRRACRPGKPPGESHRRPPHPGPGGHRRGRGHRDLHRLPPHQAGLGRRRTAGARPADSGTTWHAAGLITSAGMVDETALFMARYSRDPLRAPGGGDGPLHRLPCRRAPLDRHQRAPDGGAPA